MQFRREKLSDFYFKCGLLSHFTGQCNRANFEMITLNNGYETRMFGLWLKAERREVVVFKPKQVARMLVVGENVDEANSMELNSDEGVDGETKAQGQDSQRITG